MLHAVLVASHQAPSCSTVIGVLASAVEQMRVPVQALNHLGANRRLLAEPDGRAKHQDICPHHLLKDGRPLVDRPAVCSHVRVDADRDVMIDGAYYFYADLTSAHDLNSDIGQPLGV